MEQADSAVCDAFLSWGWQDNGLVRRPPDQQVLRPSDPVLLRALRRSSRCRRLRPFMGKGHLGERCPFPVLAISSRR